LQEWIEASPLANLYSIGGTGGYGFGGQLLIRVLRLVLRLTRASNLLVPKTRFEIPDLRQPNKVSELSKRQ
jgi:hypothetical protein